MGQTGRRRERGREDHERAGKGKKGAETERARPLPCLSFQCFGLARRLNLSCTVKSVGRVESVTRQPNNATRTNRVVIRRSVFEWREIERRERERKRTNESIGRTRASIQVYARQRRAVIRGRSWNETNRTHIRDRETEQWGISGRPFSSPVCGLRMRHTTRPACVLRREKEERAIDYITAPRHRRESSTFTRGRLVLCTLRAEEVTRSKPLKSN